MIRQYLPQTNESATLAKSKNFLRLNEAYITPAWLRVRAEIYMTYRPVRFVAGDGLVHARAFRSRRCCRVALLLDDDPI